MHAVPVAAVLSRRMAFTQTCQSRCSCRSTRYSTSRRDMGSESSSGDCSHSKTKPTRYAMLAQRKHDGRVIMTINVIRRIRR